MLKERSKLPNKFQNISECNTLTQENQVYQLEGRDGEPESKEQLRTQAIPSNSEHILSDG